MTTEAQIVSNQTNALLSTGPRTVEGKARSAMNRLAHGLRSNVVVIPGEDATEWERFRTGIVQSFAPTNALETELVGRIALGFWRLRRCTVLESLMAEVHAELEIMKAESSSESREQSVLDPRKWLGHAEDEVERLSSPSPLVAFAQMADEAVISGKKAIEVLRAFRDDADPKDEFDAERPAFLRSVGVPDEWIKRPARWTGWTVKLVRASLAKMANLFDVELDKVLENAPRFREVCREHAQQSVEKYKQEVQIADIAARAKTLRKLLVTLMPTDAFHEKLSRYETLHLRQTLETIRTLETLQRSRRDKDPPANPPPMAQA